MRYLKELCISLPLLSGAVSVPVFAQMTPIEQARAEEIQRANGHLRLAFQHLTLPATRTMLAWGTGWGWVDKDLRDGHHPGDAASVTAAILRPLAWILLPAALVYDAVAAPVGLVASPILAGNVAFHQLRNRITPPSNEDIRSSEWQLLSASMRTRHEQAAEMIGKRLIKSEDLVAFALGFTVAHSHYMTKDNKLILVNGEALVPEDLALFPADATQAYNDLLSAKNQIPSLNYKLQWETGFMNELVARMTVETEADFVVEPKNDPDTMDQIIEKLRSAARNIESVLKTMAIDSLKS